jgi:hypothetical protein
LLEQATLLPEINPKYAHRHIENLSSRTDVYRTARSFASSYPNMIPQSKTSVKRFFAVF